MYHKAALQAKAIAKRAAKTHPKSKLRTEYDQAIIESMITVDTVYKNAIKTRNTIAVPS